MYAAGAEFSDDLNLGQASWAVSDIPQVESPKAQDQELYQSLADAARGSDLEKLLRISDAHLKELNSINAAFALIRAARMVEAEKKQNRELQEKPLNPKLLNLIRHVESMVIAATHPRGGSFDRTADPEEDSSSDESKVEDQGLHMAWTLSSISWALGLLGYRNEKLLISLASLVKPVCPHFSPHQLQNCLWAFASLGMKEPGPFFEAAVESIEQRIADCSNESLVAILTSFAKVKVFNSNLFGVAAEVLAKEGSLNRPQDIANCTWAFASAGHSHPDIFSGLSTFAMQRLHEFQPEQVALLVWAFSSVRCKSEDLFEAVQNHVAERYTKFSPDSLSNVLQAFALVGHRGSQVILEATAEYILANLKAYSPKALSKVIFTISQTRGYVNLALQNALAEAFLSSMDGMTASLLTATLMAFSKVKLEEASSFFRRAAEKVAPVLSDFDSSGFVRLSKVFAQAGIDQSFAQEITEEALERIPTLRAFELVILTRAMLGMSQASPHLLESIAEHGSSVLPQMSQKELANFIRSLSGLGLTSASSTGEAIFKQAAIKATRHLMTRKEDRRSKTSDLACLSRAFARAVYATGPVADKFQAAGSEVPSELLEVIRNFLTAAVKEAHAHLDEFRASPSCLVGVLWAASQCGVPCDALTQVAKAVLLPPDAGGCDTHVQRIQLLELAELAQALTSLGVDAPELYRAISDKAMQCLQENDAGTKAKAAEEQLVPASELLRFLATAGLLASALARTTSEKVIRMLAEADAGKAKIPAWVIARCIAGLALAVPAEPVISALKVLAAAAAARVVELLPEERALIFWSLSLHGCYEAIFDSMLEQTPWTVWAAKPQEEFLVSENGIMPSGKLMALCQVHLADLALQLEGGRNRKGLSQAQRQHVLEAATLMQRTLSKEAFVEADAISQALASMDLVASVGHSSPEGLPLGVSISSPNMRQSRVTIQVDQPGDFLLEIDSSCAHRFPPTTLRRRLLWRLGYTVVVLPWYEVSRCDPEQLRGVLRARLGAVSPPSPSFLSASAAVSAKVARSTIGAIARHGLPDAYVAEREGPLESQVLTADTGGSGDSQSSQESSSGLSQLVKPLPEIGPKRSWKSTSRPPGLSQAKDHQGP